MEASGEVHLTGRSWEEDDDGYDEDERTRGFDAGYKGQEASDRNSEYMEGYEAGLLAAQDADLDVGQAQPVDNYIEPIERLQ